MEWFQTKIYSFFRNPKALPKGTNINMEYIYHRRRSKHAAVHGDIQNNGIMYLKRQEQGSVIDGAQTPPLARQPLPTSSCSLESNETKDQIEVGCIYEIDHERLPPRTPVQLRSIRVVMVSEKTESNVSVRFPSFQSLQSYFTKGIIEMYPELDEKFVMGTKLAEKMLNRKVPSQEFAEKKNSQEFWVVISTSSFSGLGDVVSKKAGQLFSELKGNGMVGWGVRRQVKFIGRHRESYTQSSSSLVGKRDIEMDEGNEEEEQVKEEQETEEEEGEEDEEDEESLTEETKLKQKRRRHSSRLVRMAKKAKHETQKNVKTKTTAKAKNRCKQIYALKNPQDRWSKERYKTAEKKLMEVMKAKGAVYGNPILRPELRAEARKLIGDTGLLDHLLKHMAGKVAPGGGERFRRRHNAEGSMEYWLESADLVDIRKEAGIQDPYWTPQPGWKLGDCPTQDPVCAKELKQLKEETSKIERDMEELVSKKQMEEEMTKLRNEMELLSKKQKEESLAIVVSNHSGISQEELDLDTSFLPLTSDLDSSLVKLEKYEEQLKAVVPYVRRIEEEIRKLKSKMDQETRSHSALMGSTDNCAEKDKRQGEEERASVPEEKKEVGSDQLIKTKTTAKETENTAAAAKEKAAKIQRLKSGFRICKPQGTFLWPNNNSNNSNGKNNMLPSQVVVQVEDLLVVPTPPSVSSSTASAPPQLPYYHHYHLQHPASPVKPLAERRAVKVTVSSAGGDHSNFSTTTTTTTTTTDNKKTTTHINLNDLPNNPGGEGFCRTPSSSRKTVTTTSIMPRVLLSAAKDEMGPLVVAGGRGSSGKALESGTMISYTEKQQGRCSSSSTPSAASCLPKGVGNWLALATPNPAQKDSNRG